MARIIHILFFVSLSCSAAIGQADSDPNPDSRVGHWIGELERNGAKYPVVLDISRSVEGLNVTVDLPDYCVYGCPAQPRITRGRLLIQTQLITGMISATFRGDQIAGTAQILDRDSRINLRRERIEPTIYVEEALTFQSDDATLAGTLVKPAGDGPFPVIVWTHRSTPETRKTFHYHGRAHLLAQHGIASVIYDKRGAGESTGDEMWKPEKLANDAMAAIDAVKNRPDIDAAHIGIAGFGQGGWVAAIAASKRKDISFVVAGATPGVTEGEQNIFSVSNRLRHKHFDQDAIQAATAFFRQLYEYYQTGEGKDAVVKAMKTAEAEPWFADSYLQRKLFLPKGGMQDGKHPAWRPFSPDPTEPWRNVHVPVLSMWGEKDNVMPADVCKQRVEEALGQANNTDYQMVIVPKANGGIWRTFPIGRRPAWPRQAEGHHQTMVDWIKAHVGKSK